jgi:hypothetical protein
MGLDDACGSSPWMGFIGAVKLEAVLRQKVQ